MTEVDELKDEHDYNAKVNHLFNLRYALSKCIYINEELISQTPLSLALSQKGEEVFKYLKEGNIDINNNLINCAIFIDFYHDDFYLDISKTNVQELEDYVSKLILIEGVKFPWIYGRELYDKYFEESEDQEQVLEFDNTKVILSDTYKGVFQVDNLIFGAFGVLKSKVCRAIYPRTDLFLWHCSDPSCSKFHKASLSNSKDSLLLNLLRDIEFLNEEVTPINLDSILTDEDSDDFFDPYQLKSFYELLVNCFDEDEHRRILQRVIEKEEIRKMLPQSLQKGGAADIVTKLNKAQCFSLLLICDDLTVLNHIERLVEENVIYIPNTEIRESEIRDGSGHYNTFLQFNKLGFRVNALYVDLSLPKIKKLLKDVNNESPYREQLDWKLRKYNALTSLDQKISKYVLEETPIKAIQETIFSGPVQLEKAFNSLPGTFETPITPEEEKKLVEKIAWKLGFNINMYPPYIESFWKSLEIFKSDVLSSTKYNENDKARIRSSAVNLFVSIEEILQQALSFITWSLLSDHYLDTKFKYVYEDARDFMVSKLNNYEYSANLFLKFDPSGKNTLFPLVSGFKALTKICDNIIQEASIYKRPDNEFPSFYNSDPLKLFPFEHKVFVLDMKPDDFERIRGAIDSIPSEFGRGNLMDIRNRLQHKREDFPNQQEMLNAVDAIVKCFGVIENEGIYPNVFLFKNSHTDEYSRAQITCTNYKGKNITLSSNPELDGVHLPSAFHPLINLDNIFIGNSIHPVIFKYEERSRYQTYWKDYPRKKFAE